MLRPTDLPAERESFRAAMIARYAAHGIGHDRADRERMADDAADRYIAGLVSAATAERPAPLFEPAPEPLERPQVAIGTAVDADGTLRTVWADVDLSAGPLRLVGGRWVCGVGEFARRHAEGTGRMLRSLGTVTDPAVPVHAEETGRLVTYTRGAAAA